MEDEYTEVLEEKIKKIIKLNNCLEEEIYNCNRKLKLITLQITNNVKQGK